MEKISTQSVLEDDQFFVLFGCSFCIIPLILDRKVHVGELAAAEFLLVEKDQFLLILCLLEHNQLPKTNTPVLFAH